MRSSSWARRWPRTIRSASAGSIQARERGATIIHVDPRFTRTSAMADIWVPLRAGTDIALLGAIINYVLDERARLPRVRRRTTRTPRRSSATTSATPKISAASSRDGTRRSGVRPESWLYEGVESSRAEQRDDVERHGHVRSRRRRAALAPDRRRSRRDAPASALRLPVAEAALRALHAGVRRACVRHAARRVHAASPTPSSRRRARRRPARSATRSGWTQHSTGAQIIRAAAILQLLLGNIGRPGGGIMALRGHASIQGSTDIPTLYDIMPGYLPMPDFEPGAHSLADYIEQHGADTGWWANIDKYIVSLLKAWYGDAATREQRLRLQLAAAHHRRSLALRATGSRWPTGKLEGLFVFGQNPAVGAPNSRLERRALANLNGWSFATWSRSKRRRFWYDSPEVERGELRTADIKTEVFLMPAAGHVEKEGCFTNTQRLVQWRQKAVDPPGDARSDAWFVYPPRAPPEGEGRSRSAAAQRRTNALTWDYPTAGPHDEPNVEEVLQEINGRRVADGALVSGFAELADDGSTACGCWIYSGVYPSTRSQSRERARVARLPRARLGLRVAGRSPHPLQPRVGETGRHAVERAQEAGVVGCSAPASGRARRPRLHRDEASRLPARRQARAATRRCAGRRRSSCTRRRRLAVGADRPEGRTAARALRAARIAARERVVSAAARPIPRRTGRSVRTIATCRRRPTSGSRTC